MGEGVCRGESTGRVCFNEETTWGTFLKNDMRWVDTKHIFVKHGPDDTDQNEGSKRLFLEELSVAELRQEAKKRGHRSVGIKRDLVERLMSNEPPGQTTENHQNTTVVARENAVIARLRDTLVLHDYPKRS